MLRLAYRASMATATATVRACLSLWAKPGSSAALVLRRTGPFDSARRDEGHLRFWVQAVSVGEVALARRFTVALLDRFADATTVLTSSTPAGQRLLDNSFPDDDRAMTGPFPFDDVRSVRRALDAYRPTVLILLETELWPTLIEETAARGIPIVVFNGRLSARSERGYMYLGPLMRRTLSLVNLFGVQAGETAARLHRLGIPAEHVVVTGNMKYDNINVPVSDGERARLRGALGLAGAHTHLVVAGSTRPGEEEVVMTAFCGLRAEFPDVQLILAPRHLRRVPQVESVIEKHDIEWRRRSEQAGDNDRARVILLDTIGELQSVYSLADVTFVGGGLFPGTGGHNPLEPAALGKPVIFGPHMDNCRDIADALVEAGGAITVTDAEQMTEALHRLLADETFRSETGDRARHAAHAGRGATTRNLDLLAGLLEARAYEMNPTSERITG